MTGELKKLCPGHKSSLPNPHSQVLTRTCIWWLNSNTFSFFKSSFSRELFFSKVDILFFVYRSFNSIPMCKDFHKMRKRKRQHLTYFVQFPTGRSLLQKLTFTLNSATMHMPDRQPLLAQLMHVHCIYIQSKIKFLFIYRFEHRLCLHPYIKKKLILRQMVQIFYNGSN